MVVAELASIPLAVAGSVSKGVQQEKHDIQRKLPSPHQFLPHGIALPSPEDIINEVNAKVEEVLSIPKEIVERGFPPPPHQLLRELRSRKPFEMAREHFETIPTPYSAFKSSPLGRDLPPNPRDFLSDIERAMDDVHNLMEEGKQFAETEIPIMIENGKVFHSNVTAFRHVAVEMGHAGAKSMLRISKSLSKLMNDMAEGGIWNVVF